MSSLERLLSVLDLFTEERPIWNLEEIIEAKQFSRSMAYRYVKELGDSGLLMPIGRGRFVLGPRIIEFDRQIRVCDPLLAVSQPIMRDTIDEIGDGMLTLSSLYGDRIMCTHQEPESSPLKITYSRGRTVPLFNSSTSRAIVAHLPERRLVKMFLEYRPEISAAGLGEEWDEFREKLREIRRVGICLSYGAIDPGVICAAVPLFSGKSTVVGALCLVQRDRGQEVKDTEKSLIRRAADQISEGVGALLSQNDMAPMPRPVAAPFLANATNPLVDA